MNDRGEGEIGFAIMVGLLAGFFTFLIFALAHYA